MSRKFLVLLGMTVGSLIGGYIPVMLGADIFSLWSIFGNAAGGIAGIWISYKLTGSFS